MSTSSSQMSTVEELNQFTVLSMGEELKNVDSHLPQSLITLGRWHPLPELGFNFPFSFGSSSSSDPTFVSLSVSSDEITLDTFSELAALSCNKNRLSVDLTLLELPEQPLLNTFSETTCNFIVIYKWVTIFRLQWSRL